MTDGNHVLESAEPCIGRIIDKESGAGANATSAAEMVLVTTSPLSELIWTPQEGASLKYTNSSNSEKEIPILWKAESFNTIVSTSPCTNGGECGTSRDHIAVDSMAQSTHNSDRNTDGVASLGSPRRSVDPQPTSLTTLHEQDSSSYGEIKLVKDMDEADLDFKKPVNNDVYPYSPRNIERFDSTCPAKDAVDNTQNKSISPGPRPYLAESKAGFATTAVTSTQHLKEMVEIPKYQISGLIGVSDSHDPMSAKTGKSIPNIRSTECQQTGLPLGYAEDDIRKATSLACFRFDGSQHSYGIPSKNRGCHSKDSVTAALLSHKVGKGQIWHANIRNETAEFRSQSACNINPGKVEKGKEKILFDEEDYDSSSKEREDSNESVESSNSRRLISKGKRAFRFDMKISEGCKKIKRESNENFCSGSLIRKDSSFVNWISTITSSFSRYDQSHQTMTSLSLLPRSYNSMKENFGSLPISHEKTVGVMCKTVGFDSFFQALYCPNIIVPNTTIDDDHQRRASTSKDAVVLEEQHSHSGNRVSGNFFGFNLIKRDPARGERTYNGSKELDLSKPLAVSNLHIVCGGDSGKSHNQKDFPSKMINISSSSSKICEKLKQNTGQASALKSMNTSSSSARKDYMCVEEKGNRRFNSDLKSPVNTNDKDSFFENLWITRFLRKVPSPSLRSVKSNLSIDDNGSLNKEQNFPENHFSPCLKSQRESNQMLKPRMSSIIPSESFKKTDLAASCSAKRFDLNPSKVSHNHNLSCTPVTCFFCGKDGHSLRECSEMAESDLQDFKKFMDLYGGKDISSCFCMHCFQVNHWAISCPHAFLKIKNNNNSSHSVAHESCNMMEDKHDSRTYAGNFSLWSLNKNKEHVHKCKLPEQRDSRMKRRASPTANDYEDYQAESMVNTKQRASSSSENESRGNPIIPFYKWNISTNITNEQNGIFKAVRKLRLSRTDVIRWMKSPSVSYSLEGFFVRLRLGKWEKGLGGTGYQVARIISANRENCLSVSVGHIKCSIECCFVSNNDFIQEELRAWLSSTLEADGKLPSIEELKKKLKEIEELGCPDCTDTDTRWW